MKTDPKVIAALQAGCATLAHLAGQYQVDVQQLKAMDLDWLACRVKKWYGGSECFLRKFAKRLLYYGEDPVYDAGEVRGAAGVTELLTRARDLVYAAFNELCTARKMAWDFRADGTPDLFEHAIQELEHQAYKIERELDLIGKLGEGNYIGARLEDG